MSEHCPRCGVGVVVGKTGGFGDFQGCDRCGYVRPIPPERMQASPACAGCRRRDAQVGILQRTNAAQLVRIAELEDELALCREGLAGALQP